MATYHGNDGVVLEGANTFGEVTAFTYTVTARTAEDSAMGDTAATHLVGKTEASGNVTCHLDTDDTAQGNVLDAGSSVTLHLRPEGTGTGLVNYEVPAIITSVGYSVEQEGIVSVSFDFIRNGAHIQTNQI